MPVPERILLVADRHADAPQLLAALRRLAPGTPSVTLLFPAFATVAVGGEDSFDWVVAADRAARCSRHFRLAGVELEEAIVGDPDPLRGAEDAHHARGYDRVVFATPAADSVPAAGRA